MGVLPDRARPIHAELTAREEVEAYVLEVLLLDLNGVEPVPAYFTRPRTAIGPGPAVVYDHAHGGDYVLGKDEFVRGRSAMTSISRSSHASAGSCERRCSSAPRPE